MKITLLGTGTSTGVPQIGCSCKVCRSADPHDNRLRASILVENGPDRILIDCGPDFRTQMLRYALPAPTALLITHEHYDHVGGIDDLRPFCARTAFPIYAEARVLDALRRHNEYMFGAVKYPGVPNLDLHAVSPADATGGSDKADVGSDKADIGSDKADVGSDKAIIGSDKADVGSDKAIIGSDKADVGRGVFVVGQTPVVAIRAYHYKLPVLGFRIGRMAYLTDLSAIPVTELSKLGDLDLVIIDALRLERHMSHFSLSEALALARRIGARRTLFTHMSHQMGLHAEVNAELPDGIALGYDGEVIEI